MFLFFVYLFVYRRHNIQGRVGAEFTVGLLGRHKRICHVNTDSDMLTHHGIAVCVVLYSATLSILTQRLK